MCGIAGFIDLNNHSSKQVLESCTNVLAHRGPDGNGFEFLQEDNAQVGLGHRRFVRQRPGIGRHSMISTPSPGKIVKCG